MKKLAVLLMLLALAVFSPVFVGCGGDNGSSSEEPAAEEPEE